MPKITYSNKKLSPASLKLIATCNAIIADYVRQGFTLTLRQLCYQLVSRDLIANRMTEYKRLGAIVNDARLCGLVDWEAIEDRTRNLKSRSCWDSPADIVKSIATQFWIDHWADQQYRPEIWIEKDALVGVIEGVCNELDVPFFSCRGYTSQSEMWGGAMRLMHYSDHDQTPVIFHLGDHDPSGKDMTRDIIDRMRLFMGGVKVERLALNMDQVGQYHPPPNPAKITDSRATSYIAEFGKESWELDALEPAVISTLIRNAVTPLIDQDRWKVTAERVMADRRLLGRLADDWDAIEEKYSS